MLLLCKKREIEIVIPNSEILQIIILDAYPLPHTFIVEFSLGEVGVIYSAADSLAK